MATAIYPGSFDPITNGHVSILRSGLVAFDKITVAVLNNEKKKPLFTVEERMQMIRETVVDLDLDADRVEVDCFEGLLVNYANGSTTNVTATLTASGAPGVQTGTYGGSETAADTDAYTTFHGIVSMPGVIQYGDEGWWVEVTFTGLDPAKTYAFATSANRDGSGSDYPERVSRFTISSVDAAVNASSSGVTVLSNESVAFSTGENTVSGYVARWTGIRPGTDGEFTVTVQAEPGSPDALKAYGPSVFMLAEESGEPPVQHTLDVTDDGNGNVTLDPAGGVYNAGTIVTLTPVASSGYEFAGWTGTDAADVSYNGDGTWSITMDADKSVTANFVEATVPAWVAYNDCAWASLQPETNITKYTLPAEGTASGSLVDYATGDPLPASVAVSVAGSPGVQVSQGEYSGSEANAGTDAYQTFHGIADSTGVIYYGSTAGWSVTLTFTGLDPAAEYTFATTANRDNDRSDYLDRISRFTIADVDGAANASTDGVTVISNESVAFSTGYNTVNGYVARWTGIRPGADGDFTVTAQADDRNEAYGPSVFMLAQGGGGPINRAPDAPEVVQPVDDATGVATSPTLEVAVSDPDGDAMDVSFYGRAVGAGGEAGEPFTIIAIPDTQMATQSFPQNFTAQTQWIVNNAAAENIVFVTHLGDITNTASVETQWQNADAAMDLLDPAGIPYSVGPGNHDLTIYPSTTYYPNYFGVSRFTGKSWYQGAYEAANNYDSYSLFSASGMDFILINLRYQPSTAVLDWADALLKSHTDRRGIVVSHSILNINNSWTSEGITIFNALKDNPNLFLMLCGHMHSASDGAAQRADLGDDGHTIYSVLADYQDFPNGGNGYLLKLQFVPAEDSIDLVTYSPTLPNTLSGEYSPATLVYDMEGSASAPFELIGTVTGVATGTSASLVWADRLADTEYEWYAVASDGAKTTQSATWSFTTAGVANTAPVLDPVGNKTASELAALAFTATASDDDGDPLAFSLVDAPAGAGISAGGAFSWTPTEAQGPGSYPFTVKVCDDAAPALCDQETITVTVNEVNTAPGLDPIGDKSVDELVALAFNATASDADLPANTLAFSLVDAPEGAAITAGGAFSWAPTEAQGPGTYPFTVKVCDDATPALCDQETITVTVNEVNLAPTANSQSVTTNEDTTLGITLTGTDADLPANVLTYAVVTGPTNGALSGSAPDLTYTPNADFHGADSFTFTVNDGTTDSAAATVSITVGDANDAPVLAPVAGGTYAELSAIDFSASATDPDGDALSFSLVNAPAGAVIDPGTGAFSWTPTEAQGPGSYPFTVKVCDDGDPELCDEVEITITVTEVNVAPVLAAIGDKTANEMSSLAFTAAATDADLPANSLTFSLEGAPTGATINPATGAFSWTPTESQGPGTYPFSVKVCDNGDPALCDKEAITVTVNEAGLAPTANAQSITTAEDVPVSISLSGSDPDGDTLTFAIVTPPANGALSGSAPNLTYTPSADFNGADSFTFTVNDGTLDSEPATVSISVTPVNDAPVAKPKSVVTQLNASVPVELTGSDVDGDALTFQILTQPLHGTLSGTAPDLTYTPAGDYTGADSFTFAVSDGQVQSNPATVNIVVEAGQAPAFRLYLPLVSRQ